MRVRVDEFLKAVNGALEDYAGEVTYGTKHAVEETVKECLKQVKAFSPVGVRGDYQKGWRSRNAYTDKTSTRRQIYNKTDYQLTHLLEYGHDIYNKSGGKSLGRFDGKPHIMPAYEQAMRNLEERVKKVVEGSK